MQPPANIFFDAKQISYQCSGSWSILNIGALTPQIQATKPPKDKTVIIDGAQITSFDSAGAISLVQFINTLKTLHNTTQLVNFNEQQQALMQLIESKKDALHYETPKRKKDTALVQLGKETMHKISQVNGLIVLIGELSIKMLGACRKWRRLQIPSLISNISSTGLRALPILALLSFLIGVVLAYQMGLQLETYGASIYIAYLSGMTIFREFGPLITAIIVAGRTSSSFTAQIGSMKINEEIDALYTMGLSPTELLVIPKVLGLMLVFPLLIFWADCFSILGALMMSKFILHISYADFMSRLQDAVGAKQMFLGLYKAPAFALLIALVGCFQGFRVESSATSLGSQTTKSVVQALFLIIIADAAYSVVYRWMDL